VIDYQARQGTAHSHCPAGGCGGGNGPSDVLRETDVGAGVAANGPSADAEVSHTAARRRRLLGPASRVSLRPLRMRCSRALWVARRIGVNQTDPQIGVRLKEGAGASAA